MRVTVHIREYHVLRKGLRVAEGVRGGGVGGGAGAAEEELEGKKDFVGDIRDCGL